jgi:hypothetical protein
MVIGFSAAVYGQESPAPTTVGNVELRGLPDDWTHHHVVFSDPGTAEQAKKKGTYNRWLKAVNNPRYVMQQLKHGLSAQGPAAADVGAMNAMTLTANTPSTERGGRNQAPSTAQRDWSLSLGGGGVAPNMFPAKFDFDITTSVSGTPGPPPTGNCLTDFVVYGLNVAGSATQANLVAVDDLYSGTSPTGLCGTTPHVKWAYNASTIGGRITTSPVLSQNGTEVAFVESNGSASVLHILKWLDSSGNGDGTVTSPATLTQVAPASFPGCSAPCMASISYGSAGTTISSPFYIYSGIVVGNDTLYVANDAGQIFEFTGVFLGTPALANSATVASGVRLTCPVLDEGSGNIFLGGSDGKLYAVSSTDLSGVGSIAAGSGSANGGGIVDCPIVDASNGTVTAFTAANAANVGNTGMTANTSAVALQTDTTTPFGSPQVATLGQGTKGTTASLNVVGGSFDNNYFNWSGGANTGYLYMIGTASTATSPHLYQIGYGGVGSVSVSTPYAGGFSTIPTVSFSGGGGSGATATASGSVDNINVTSAGSGYTSTPTVTFSGGGGTGASGTANLSGVVTVLTLQSPGSGYTSAPTVTIAPPTSGTTATATATITGEVTGITVTNPGSGYSSSPTVHFSGGGGGSGAAATANLSEGVSSVTINTAGTGYTAGQPPTVSFTNGGGSGAAGTANLTGVVASVSVGAGGAYSSAPTVSFSGGGGGAGAAATAVLNGSVTAVNVTNVGSGYTTVPSVSFSGGGGGSGASASANLTGEVTALHLTSGGSGYSGTCTVSFSGGGGGAGAAATCTISSFSHTVNNVTLTSGGSGYSSAPTVSVTGSTGGSNAVVTATESNAVASITLNNGGSGYTSAPTVTIAAPGGTGNTTATATATISGPVASVNVTNGGTGYTSVPTVNFSGSGGATATATLSQGVVSVTVTSPGSGYTSAPTVGFSGGSGSGTVATANISNMVASITVTSGGTGYTSAPSVTFTGGGGGSGAAATASESGAVNALSVTNPGSGYTSAPTVSFSGGGGSGATATAGFGNGISNVTISSGGSGYTSAPTVAFSGGGGGGADATATINVTNIAVTYAGGGYSTAPTVNLSSGTLTATANLNAGNIMSAGTPPSSTVSSTAGLQASPVTEVFNPNVNGGTDFLFFGYAGGSVGDVTSANVTSGSSVSIGSAVSEPGGTSGIAIDNIASSSSSPQASSIYFSTLAQAVTHPPVNISSVTANSNSSTYTATTATPHGFSSGDSVTIAGVECSSGSTPPCSNGYGSFQPNGTFTISNVTSTTFRYSSSFGQNSVTSKANTGTAIDNTKGTNAGFQAIKLTQNGLD